MWQVVREDDCSYKKCLYSSELIHKNIVNINHMREPTENVENIAKLNRRDGGQI